MHIGCNNSGKFVLQCIRPILHNINDKLRNQILHAHNNIRNDIAIGKYSKLKEASKMLKMV